MSFLQDEMIAEEGHAFNGNSASLTFNKQRLGSISKGQSDLNRNKKKINKKLSFSDLCQVELNGSILPPELLQENIEYTERSGLANLLSVYYVQNNLVVLFVRGSFLFFNFLYVALFETCRCSSGTRLKRSCTACRKTII
jgi:hypothetical protein